MCVCVFVCAANAKKLNAHSKCHYKFILMSFFSPHQMAYIHFWGSENNIILCMCMSKKKKELGE